MKFFLFIGLLWSLTGLAQDTLDLGFLTTQRTSGDPFSLPISVNDKGQISIFGSNGTDRLSFQPTLQVGINLAFIQYSQPIALNRFNIYPIHKDLGWIEVKRRRLEIGAGLSTIMQSALTVGIVPYKGSMQTLIRFKNSKEDKSLPFKMPEKLAELEEWNNEDIGTFQTYGGVTIYAGISAGIVHIATGDIGIQNQFLVEMKKVSEDEVHLKISEEDLKRGQIVIGPPIATATLASFKGKRFSAQFNLKLSNPDHHELFKEALKGNLHLLQSRLSHEEQNLSWTGSDRHFFIGIPLIAGKVHDSGHYDMDVNGIETELDFTGSRNQGLFTPLRNHQDFVYETEEGLVVIWSSEMNRTDMKAFESRFLSKGRIMGVKGFDRELPRDTKFGSVVSQIGVHVSREEISALDGINMEEVGRNFKERCLKEKLSCSKEKNLKKIITKLTSLLQKPWAEMRGELGLLLIREPALVYAVSKTMKYKKEVYFKFLSEKFQSLEGSSPIEF